MRYHIIVDDPAAASTNTAWTLFRRLPDVVGVETTIEPFTADEGGEWRQLPVVLHGGSSWLLDQALLAPRKHSLGKVVVSETPVDVPPVGDLPLDLMNTTRTPPVSGFSD